MENTDKNFKPYISADDHSVKEFTVRAILLGAFFGILFGAATVYLALKAGLTVSASIPIAVLAISIGRRFLGTTILENNIIQTAGSAGESVAAGVVFTLPAFLFLTDRAVGTNFFTYGTILMLAMFGGILGTLMMIPLRRSLIVKEHGNLPYPEGTACASVLIAGEKGGNFAKTAYLGLATATIYAVFQRIFRVVVETASWGTSQATRAFPSATVAADITPEYLGVGYIIGPRIAGLLVAGGVLSWLALIPLLASLVPADVIAAQLVKLGYLADILTVGGPGNWHPEQHYFDDWAQAIYKAYVRQIGAGAVAAGGFITLLKTLPTIVSSFKDSLKSMKEKTDGQKVARTEQDLDLKWVLFGAIGLVFLMVVLPQIPGDSILSKLLIGILVVVFGFFFVTVSSRIVGIIGSSSNPISGMTIATLMGTALIFIAFGLTGQAYEPMALVVGSMICIAAANAGATSQDLKTGYIIGATPKYQQIALFVGVIVSSIAIGLTIKILDTPTTEMLANGIQHAIGTDKYPAPQGTLMATLIRGLLSFNLDWNFVLVGFFLAVTIELCGVNALSFAVGAYLPLSTTLPIFIGGLIRGVSDWWSKRKNEDHGGEEDLRPGNLFSTGLVAGGALMGVITAGLTVFGPTAKWMENMDFSKSLTPEMGNLIGLFAFLTLCTVLWVVSRRKN
jgi:OPT family oligopeptide transporter